MLPQALIEEFWDRVSTIVKKKCHLSDERARVAVTQFRREVEPKTGEMIYHDSESSVADTISAAVKHGEYLDAVRKGKAC